MPIRHIIDRQCSFAKQVMNWKKIVVTTGGFLDESTVHSNQTLSEISNLEAFHQEADTHVVLHAVTCGADTTSMSAWDWDFLILLLAHLSKLVYEKLWMKAGSQIKEVDTNKRSLFQGCQVGQTKRFLHSIYWLDVTAHHNCQDIQRKVPSKFLENTIAFCMVLGKTR